MPLPPAPTQRATLLTSQALETPEKPPARSPSKHTEAPGLHSKPAAKKIPVAQQPVIARTPPALPKKANVARSTGPAKLFVLDTNVLMHDPMCLFLFEEHDVYLPMIVLEELDSHKKGMTEVARNARQTSRSLDALAAVTGSDMRQGLPLNTTGHIEASGKLFFQTQVMDVNLPISLPQGRQPNFGRGPGLGEVACTA